MFPFFNELDLLEIRLHELSDTVDLFILVEATKTHSGKDKPLYYDENKDRFSEFSDKILYIIVEDMPMTREELDATLTTQDRHWIESDYQKEDSWVRERFQRNAIMRGLTWCYDDDIIIISDADEIVKRDVIGNIRSGMLPLCDGSNAVEQVLHTYYMNWKCINMPWWGSKIIRKKFLNNITTPSEVRFHTPACQYIYNGGWHFNFLGGAEAIAMKLQAYAHQEFNNEKTINGIQVRLNAGVDAIGRQYQYEKLPVAGLFHQDYPRYVIENIGKFQHLFDLGQ